MTRRLCLFLQMHLASEDIAMFKKLFNKLGGKRLVKSAASAALAYVAEKGVKAVVKKVKSIDKPKTLSGPGLPPIGRDD